MVQSRVGARGWRAVVVLVIVVLAAAISPAPATAITLDGPTRECLVSRIGAAATQRIALAAQLTPAQRRAVAACRRAAANRSPVVWSSDGNGSWRPSGTPPSCAGVQWSLPLDSLQPVEAILDPGQIRGGRYKAHGGFRMTQSATVVRAPIDGYITAAAAYRETATGASGGPDAEVQYLLDIQNPCGLAVRFDHLKVLDPSVASALAAVPVRDDSRTTTLTPPVRVSRGQVLATVVGHTQSGVNPTFDFGAYDYRERQYNRRSEAELRAFGPDGLLGLYALCWLDLFGSPNAATLRALPRTSTEADQGSDVCR